MARYTGPVFRLSRREGVDLFLKGGHRRNEKLEKRLTQIPGTAKSRRMKLSDYGLQLREKQKLKRIYGVLERQFRVFFNRAALKTGVTGETLIQLLERRLDNVVFRLFFATSRREARQLVNHGHIFVNGKCVNIPSYTVKSGDKITPRSKEANVSRIKARLEMFKDLVVPSWLSLDRNQLEGIILRYPTKVDAALPVEESLIVELYSK
ncbi:MAG: 30S ribosomal protein S4 [Omnitrophica bacterium RIFCSPHIGHO2_02_FULL_49_9]|nr:MAG: 30S ribosomal protein S4 [Omnitrophica bacterium RIFCSPHIGHO2_02_FULL_49_9]